MKKDNRLYGAQTNDIEVFVDPDPEKTSYNFYIRRMTDGLPIIPPTRERVLKFWITQTGTMTIYLLFYHPDRERSLLKKWP